MPKGVFRSIGRLDWVGDARLWPGVYLHWHDAERTKLVEAIQCLCMDADFNGTFLVHKHMILFLKPCDNYYDVQLYESS
jgi:hypothetical protein